MEKNTEYFITTEDNDAKKFSRLASETGWFTTISRSSYGDEYDFSATAIDNRKMIIELKSRDISADDYDDYIIEVDKLADCYLHASLTNSTPIYINFFNDDKVLIWNLFELKTPPVKKKMRRQNPGFDTMEVSNVYKLAKSDAYMYSFKKEV